MSYLDFPKKVEREKKTEAAREPADLMLESALALAEKDFHVFPCEPNGKRPLGGHGHLDATTDAEIIERWWTARAYPFFIDSGLHGLGDTCGTPRYRSS